VDLGSGTDAVCARSKEKEKSTASIEDGVAFAATSISIR
jgi:hypothetical protein